MGQFGDLKHDERELTSRQVLFLYRAANGHVYRISFLVLWSSHFDFRVASDDLIKKKRREVHVVESALATAMGVHSVEGRRLRPSLLRCAEAV